MATRIPHSRHPRSRSALTGIATLGVLGLIAACSPADSTSSTPAATPGATAEGTDEIPSVTLKVGTLYGPENWQTTPMTAYTQAVTEATDGQIEFEFYYAGSLVPPAEMATGLRDGLIDLAHIVPAYTPATFTHDTWINNLAWASDPSPVAGTLQAAAATLDWGVNTESYLAELEAEGLTPLIPRLQTVHKYGLLCKDPVISLDQARGKRVRAGGEAWSAETENLGGVPVAMPAAEVYTAFQQGLVDCFMGGPEDTHALGLADHGKHWTGGEFTGWSSAGVMMSQSTWDTLPLAAQQAMWDQLPVFLETFFESNFAINAEFVAASGDQGMVFETADDDMRAAITGHHDAVAADLPASAPAAVDDPEGLVQSWLDAHEAWLQVVTDDLGYSADEVLWSDVEDVESLDLKPWADRVYEDLLAPRRPE